MIYNIEFERYTGCQRPPEANHGGNQGQYRSKHVRNIVGSRYISLSPCETASLRAEPSLFQKGYPRTAGPVD